MDSQNSAPNSEIENNEVENRCLWCNQHSSEEIQLSRSEYLQRGKETPSEFWVCSTKHEKRITNYYNFVERFYIVYVFFVFLTPLVLAVLSFFYWSAIFAFGIFPSIGLALLIVPLLGNQITYGLGVKRTIIISRILGGILILIGLTLLIINGRKILTS
jgi:hypothetical protein